MDRGRRGRGEAEGLRRPLGVACGPQGQLLVADAEDGNIKVYQSHLELD